MAIPFLKRQSDFLYPGRPHDSRLFHADSSDQIQMFSPQVGQGYVQIIPLQEGLSLMVLDYTIHGKFLRPFGRHNQLLEFEFQIAGPVAGHSLVLPHVIERSSVRVLETPQHRVNVEVLLRPPFLLPYSHALVEHLPPQDQAITYNWASWVHRSQYGYAPPSSQVAFAQIAGGVMVPTPPPSTEQILENAEFRAIGRPWRQMTSEMHQVISQILSCPYSGRVRRTYLERKALKLVTLKLNALHLKFRILDLRSC